MNETPATTPQADLGSLQREMLLLAWDGKTNKPVPVPYDRINDALKMVLAEDIGISGSVAITNAAGVQRLASAVIAQASATTVFTAGATARYRNLKIKACNNEGVSDHTVKIYHVPSGGSPANANMIERCLMRAGWAGTEIDLAGLGPSEAIAAQVVDSGSDSDVTLTVYGEQYA